MLLKNSKLICIVAERDNEFSSLALLLSDSGYKVEFIPKFADAISVFEKTIPTAILVDLEKDDKLFSEYCFSIKSNPSYKFTKIIFFAPIHSSEKELMAFEANADDFIVKPFLAEVFLKRLIVRLDSNLNVPISFRTKTKEDSRIYIDRDSFTVYVNQSPIAVSKKEFELLHLMASHPGKIFTRDEIFEKVWKRKANTRDRTIDVHILRLRKKLGEEFISTQKGVGYRFITQ